MNSLFRDSRLPLGLSHAIRDRLVLCWALLNRACRLVFLTIRMTSRLTQLSVLNRITFDSGIIRPRTPFPSPGGIPKVQRIGLCRQSPLPPRVGVRSPIRLITLVLSNFFPRQLLRRRCRLVVSWDRYWSSTMSFSVSGTCNYRGFPRSGTLLGVVKHTREW